MNSTKLITFWFLALVLMLQILGCNTGSPVAFKPNDESPFDDGIDNQGPPPPTCDTVECDIITRHESFYQNGENNKVDILIVNDNSGSMVLEQNNLSQRFRNFTGKLSKVDWQMGFTTTDVSSGPHGIKGSLINLPNSSNKILKKNTPNAENIFKTMIQRPETKLCSGQNNCASGDEQPLNATIRAINKRNNHNKGFFRDDANLAVLVLSDEDERSTGLSGNPTTYRQVLDKFKSVWPTNKKLIYHAIIIEPNDNSCLLAQRAQPGATGYYGNLISEMVSKTGGLTGSICDTNYGPIMEKIGQAVYELNELFELAKVPIKNSIEVTLIPNQNIKYKVKGNKIIFNKAPIQGTRIDVSYKHYVE